MFVCENVLHFEMMSSISGIAISKYCFVMGENALTGKAICRLATEAEDPTV